jgi:hypothetical protein
MWMTPFYLFFGVLIIYIFQSKINFKKINRFILIFLIFFIFSPLAYLYVSITQTDKRTDYPGKNIAKKIEEKYEKNFKGEIIYVVGDEWHGGNLSYHLDSRPKWFYVGGSKSLPQLSDFIEPAGIVSTIGISNKKVTKKFSKICEKSSGIFYNIENIGFCISGSEKK